MEDFKQKIVGIGIVWKVFIEVEGGDLEGVIFSPIGSNEREICTQVFV